RGGLQELATPPKIEPRNFKEPGLCHRLYGQPVSVNTRLWANPHGMISSDAILSPSSLKKNRRSTGLPGKFPTRWLVTAIIPSFPSHATGSLVYSYLVEVPVFHCLIAARPLYVCPSSITTAFSVKH